MWKHGKTKKGKARWYCKNCRSSGIKKRKDVSLRRWIKIIKKRFIEGLKLKKIAKEEGLHLRYIQNKCAEVLKKITFKFRKIILDPTKPLVLDGTWIVFRKSMVLVAHDTEKVLSWKFVTTENYDSWFSFLSDFEGRPSGIVSDAQKGLLKAVFARFGNIPHQRCVAHVIRQSRIWLTLKPKTIAGIELLVIVKELAKVKTAEESEKWKKDYDLWLKKHYDFLKERSHFENSKRWWYTHRRLRGIRSLLSNALPNLFVYINHNIPNTTNHVEGGINSPLKFCFKEHRGLSFENKKALVNLFLNERSKRKNQH